MGAADTQNRNHFPEAEWQRKSPAEAGIDARRLGPDTSIRLLALLVEADASGRFPAPHASPMTGPRR